MHFGSVSLAQARNERGCDEERTRLVTVISCHVMVNKPVIFFFSDIKSVCCNRLESQLVSVIIYCIIKCSFTSSDLHEESHSHNSCYYFELFP